MFSFQSNEVSEDICKINIWPEKTVFYGDRSPKESIREARKWNWRDKTAGWHMDSRSPSVVNGFRTHRQSKQQPIQLSNIEHAVRRRIVGHVMFETWTLVEMEGNCVTRINQLKKLLSFTFVWIIFWFIALFSNDCCWELTIIVSSYVWSRLQHFLLFSLHKMVTNHLRSLALGEDRLKGFPKGDQKLIINANVLLQEKKHF